MLDIGANDLIKKGYDISPIAKDLIDRGFSGNGCGSGFASFIITQLIMLLFKVDFKIPCLIHDADFSESRSTKSDNKKIDANARLHKNCLVSIGDNPSKKQLRAAKYFHVALVFFSDKAYWKG